MGRTAVIFGGSGFFGMHLCRALSGDGLYERVLVADIRPPRELGPKVEYAEVDVREPITLSVSGDVEIYNFAAVHRTPGHADQEYYWTNVAGAIEVCRFAERVAAGQVVFTSSISVFGLHGEQFDDRTVPHPETAYGQSKLLAEKIHENWQAAAAGRRLVVVRPR